MRIRRAERLAGLAGMRRRDAELNFREAAVRLTAMEEAVAAVESRWRLAVETTSGRLAGGLSARELAIAASYRVDLEEERRRAVRDLDDATKAAERARAGLLQRRREEKTYQRLASRLRRRAADEAARRERRAADEWPSLRRRGPRT